MASAEDEAKAAQELADKLRRTNDQLAQLQIKLLDSMVKHLKNKRYTVGQQIVADQTEIDQIQKSMDEINKKLAPIQGELDSKVGQKESLEEQIKICRQQFTDMMEITKANLDKGKKLESRLTSQQTSFGLSTLRGYTMEPNKKRSSTLSSSAKMMFTF